MSWVSSALNGIGGLVGDDTLGDDAGSWIENLWPGSTPGTVPTIPTPTTNTSSNSWVSSLFSPQAIAAGIGGISASYSNDQNLAEKANETKESQAFQEQMQQESFAHSDKAQAAALANAKGIAGMQIGYESKRDKENRIQQAYQTAISSNQGATNLTVQALQNLIKGGQAPLGVR